MNQTANAHLNDFLRATNIAYKLIETIKLEINDELRAKNLYYKHWLILKLIYFKEAKTSTDIAILIGINKSSLSRLIDYLEQQALVVRKKEAIDRRKTYIYLTDLGKSTFDLGFQAFRRVQKKFEGESFTQNATKASSLLALQIQ